MDETTICAIATALGGAIGVIRVSGANAISIADKIFRPINSKKRISERKPYTLAFGNIVEGEEVVDEVLVSVFHAPHSYTGEDSIEISCHGSSYIMQRIMQLLTENGCTPAGPGEFTKRAFLNGKIDLSQAEAVADLISSTNKATHSMALSQLKGHFSSELANLREQLLRLTSLLELEIDFSDHEELEFADRKELFALATHIQERVAALAHSFEIGNAMKHGIPVAIVGKTNVGKSTLLNRLLHEEKAIVSNVHGTTRDYIEDTTVLSGMTFRFVDTAGIRHTDDEVETIGIERTYQKLSEARIVLWLVDDMPSEDEIKDMKEHINGKKAILVFNKMDTSFQNVTDCQLETFANRCLPNCKAIRISAKVGTNIDRLEQMIISAADIPQISESDIVVTSVRHYNSLRLANESLHRVLEAIDLGLSGDLIAEDLRIVIDNLSEITGKGVISSQETLNSIFSHFCVGK